MLPPFVPPSARAPAETLPLITEFVIDPRDRAFHTSHNATNGFDHTAESTLSATPPVATMEPEPVLPSIQEFVSGKYPVVPEPVREAEPPEPEVEPEPEPVVAQETAPSAPAEESPAAGWVDEERNAFDWQGVAQLAVQDERRADDDWTSTDWDAPTTSSAEHVASVLTQLARRLRAGELKVDVSRGASAEAALASVLAALLTEPDSDA